MSIIISDEDIAIAWLKAMEHLVEVGHDSNVITIMGPGLSENKAVRRVYDQFLRLHESNGVRRVRKVADTIFPVDLYDPTLKNAAEELFKRQMYAHHAERQFLSRGTYFQRLTSWENDNGTINQLGRLVHRLKRHNSSKRKNGNPYELATVPLNLDSNSPGDDKTDSCDLRIYDPNRDFIERGFPCLSHISLTLINGRLDMTALYRNQVFMTKAYGNFVGLFDLLTFLSQESGYEVGELVCIATHADGELNLNGWHVDDIRKLIKNARRSLKP